MSGWIRQTQTGLWESAVCPSVEFGLCCVEASGQVSSLSCNQITAVADCNNMTGVITTRLAQVVCKY
jgi:hypothetical protein